MRRYVTGLAGVVIATGLVTACAGSDHSGANSDDVGGSIAEDYDLQPDSAAQQAAGGSVAQLTVGSKNFFAEQEVLGHITIDALRAAGAEVEDRTGLGDTQAVRASLLSGGIDLYWEYTGTGAVIHLAQADVPEDPQSVYENVAEADRTQNDIEWLDPAPANNSYAIAVREDVSDQALAGVQTISDLAQVVKQQPDKATICVGPEFEQRADGLQAVESQYGFTFPEQNVLGFPVATVYRAIDTGEQCNFGSVFRTNGYSSELGLRMLEDDQGAFPPYSPSVSTRASVLEEHPDLKPLIADISKRLDDKTLRTLNNRVEVNHESPEQVAADWLESEGLVD